MGELEPESAELMAYYVRNVAKFNDIADGCRIPRFTTHLNESLLQILGSMDAVRVVEAAVRIGDLGNTSDLKSLRRAVSRQLKARGVAGRKGKRTAPGLLELVKRISPVLLRYGVPLATSERSLLVLALREIADELGLSGDPRDELRRLKRLQAEQERGLRRALREAIARGLAPLSPLSPPSNISLPADREI